MYVLPEEVDPVTKALAAVEGHGLTYYSPFGSPATFVFQTGKGDRGLLQFVQFTEEPRGMTIRYKLVQPPAARRLSPGPGKHQG